MLVGVLRVELFLPDSNSLKAKRGVLASLKTRIRNKFNVSVAEVDNLDKWQRVSLGISLVSNEERFIDLSMSEIMNLINQEGRVEVLDHILEFY
ncbi:MAG: DUF503 domain-containing protein [bacterium]